MLSYYLALLAASLISPYHVLTVFYSLDHRCIPFLSLARIIFTWFIFLLFTFRPGFMPLFSLSWFFPAGTCVTSEHHPGVHEPSDFSFWYYHCLFFWTGFCVGIRVYYEILVFTVGNGSHDFFHILGRRRSLLLKKGRVYRSRCQKFHPCPFLITTLHIQVSEFKY